jgi:hypothetical protein
MSESCAGAGVQRFLLSHFHCQNNKLQQTNKALATRIASLIEHASARLLARHAPPTTHTRTNKLKQSRRLRLQGPVSRKAVTTWQLG